MHTATHSLGDIVQLIPRWNVAVGNVLNAVTAGVGVRLGYRLEHPWRASGEHGTAWNVYLLGDAEGRWVVTNVFLDGTNFTHDPRVDKLPFTGQYMLGLGVRIRSFALELRGVTQGKEFEGGPRVHRYGTIALGFHILY